MAAKRFPHGFTLIELIIVVLLISLSASLVIGLNFRQSDSVRLSAASRELQAFLQLARSRAVFLGQENRCFYQAASRQITAQLAARPLVLPENVSLVFDDDQHDITSDPEAIKPLLHYYPDGSAAAPLFSLVNASKRIAVTIDPLLGFVTMDQQALSDVEQGGK